MATAVIPALRQNRTVRKTLRLSPLMWEDTEVVARAEGREPMDLIVHLIAAYHYGQAAMLSGLRGGEYPRSDANSSTVTPFRRNGSRS